MTFVGNVSAPIAALKEGEGHMVTVEMQNGEIYRGLLDMSEDSMNCGLSEGKLTIELSIKFHLTL